MSSDSPEQVQKTHEIVSQSPVRTGIVSDLPQLKDRVAPVQAATHGVLGLGDAVQARQAIDRFVGDAEGEGKIIFRTSEEGKKYAINTEKGEIAGGLGKTLEGQKISEKSTSNKLPTYTHEEAIEKAKELSKKAQEALNKGDIEEFNKLSTEVYKAQVEASKLFTIERETKRANALANANISAINAAVRKAEEKNRNLKYEKMTVVDLQGKVIASIKGEDYSVAIPEGMTLQDLTVTHNHPSKTTFSPADVAVFGHNMRELRATTIDDKNYSLIRVGANIRLGFSKAAENAFNGFIDDATKVSSKGKNPKERSEIWDKEYNRLTYDWLKKNEGVYGYEYRVEE